MEKVILAAGSHVIDEHGLLYVLAEDAFALEADEGHADEPHDHAADEPCGLCDDFKGDSFDGILADKQTVSEVLGGDDAEKKDALDPATIGAILTLLPMVLDLIKKFRDRRNKK